MQTKVYVVSDPTTGSVINISKNNSEYGYVKLQQTRTLINESGFLQITKLNAIIQAKVTLLQEMKYYGGQLLDGKIIIKESLTPFNQKSPEKDLKIAGKTGIICKIDDEPIYRKTYYSSNLNAADITLKHTNGLEIQEANANSNIMQENLSNIIDEFNI